MKISKRSREARVQRRKKEIKEIKELEERVEAFVRFLTYRANAEFRMRMSRMSNCLPTCRCRKLLNKVCTQSQSMGSDVRTEKGSLHNDDKYSEEGSSDSVKGEGYPWCCKDRKWQDTRLYHPCIFQINRISTYNRSLNFSYDDTGPHMMA
jgi:hypothetical protein